MKPCDDTPPSPRPLDVAALQARLRRFSAERDWEAFQTPKNLAMAMVVEAAELLEIFQWMTPEESTRLAERPPQQQHLGEEIADVLVYLLQIADRCGVDIAAAVDRKIGLNAVKYPPKPVAVQAALPTGCTAAPMTPGLASRAAGVQAGTSDPTDPPTGPTPR